MKELVTNVKVGEQFVEKSTARKEANATVRLNELGFEGEAAVINAGEYLFFEENHIMNNKRLTLSLDLEGLPAGAKILLGHGEEAYGGSHLELDSENIYSYHTTFERIERLNAPHGLKIEGHIALTVAVYYGMAKITLSTPTGIYRSPEVVWEGRNGKIFAKCEARCENVKMRWFCPDYKQKIWMFGDSYFNMLSDARWTTYLKHAGYTSYLMSSFSGRGSDNAFFDLERALKHGTPEYIIWSMGMNDKDLDDEAGPGYVRYLNMVLDICRERGITPILTTVPCVPERSNFHKNEYVKATGHRYIDFAAAVGGREPGSSWYEGMLFDDKVHPAKGGAEALYAQAIADFPELLQK